MKILFCQPQLEHTGSEKALLEVVRGLKRETPHELYLLAGKAGPMAREFEEHVERQWVVSAPIPRRSWSVFLPYFRSFWSIFHAMRRIKRRTGVSLVYVNTVMFPQAVVAAFLNRLRCVVHVHEVESKYPWAYYQLVLFVACLIGRRIICVCHYILGQRRILLRGRLLGRARVVYNASSFDPGPVTRTVGETLQVLTAGTVTRLKGMPDLVHVARALKRETAGRRVRLKVVGHIASTKVYSEIERDIARYDLSDVLEFCGETPDMAPFYREAHVFLHPARSDVFPLVLLEAASFSLPVITTDAGGCPEAVGDGETGYVVPAGDHEAMAQRLRDLGGDPELYRRMAERAYRRYRAEFTPAVMTTRLLEALDGLI